MTKINELYRCSSCGNIVSIFHSTNGTVNCCGKEMTQLVANMQDGATEKHIPVVEKKDDGYLIKIGSVEHPMEEKHYIEFIEVITENCSYRKNLKPNQKPEFFVKTDEKILYVREYCNLHGLWQNNLE